MGLPQDLRLGRCSRTVSKEAFSPSPPSVQSDEDKERAERPAPDVTPAAPFSEASVVYCLAACVCVLEAADVTWQEMTAALVGASPGLRWQPLLHVSASRVSRSG